MLTILLSVFLALYSIHALAKFAFFFVLSYRTRRAMLDRAYAGRMSATNAADTFLLFVCVVLVVLLAIRGADSISFLAGLLVGMTVIQIYFHRFSAPLSDRESPEPPFSPIKLMSYAVQAAPWRPWKELIVITALLVWSLYGLALQCGLLR